MRIIREGELNKIKGIKRFECLKCGCIFEADNTEYKYSGSQYNESYYECECPTCKDRAFNS